MIYNKINYCDYCFEPLAAPDAVCSKCGLTKEKYHTDIGLLEPGTNLMGKYIVGRVLGRGGFGATYLAFSSATGGRVALKEYFSTGLAQRSRGEKKVSIISADKHEVFSKGAKRFYEEAKIMSKFNHNENVVSVYEFFYTNETAYYSMEYLEGIDLKGYTARKGGRISQEEALSIMKGVVNALMVVHSTGTLHRDISPDNIYICTDGKVKLIDFGAAKQVVGEQSQSLSVILKQGFAPVEQYQKGGKQGFWTDIYALGVSIYYALTGRIPDDAMSRLEQPNIEFDPKINIAPEFKAVINKCLKIKINERYQSTVELSSALDNLNIKEAAIGGNEFVETIYKGNAEGSGVGNFEGKSVLFQNETPKIATGYNPNQPVQNVSRQIPNSQYYGYMGDFSGGANNTVYPNSGYIPENRENKSNTVIILIIGGSIIAIIVVIIIAVLLFAGGQNGPQQGMPGMPGQPMSMEQGMPGENVITEEANQ
ncbi:MAG: serine/threonine protein kinase [Clostridiales bacterium]|nr:serine/threonine protein kinase [Clostridiales bacterium]